ncbi:hypothetical protein BS78_01G148700 [Paspalum vaginatum]|nr:hypothetical protein BS78_01G148700 [Paspalum vaginatum]
MNGRLVASRPRFISSSCRLLTERTLPNDTYTTDRAGFVSSHSIYAFASWCRSSSALDGGASVPGATGLTAATSNCRTARSASAPGVREGRRRRPRCTREGRLRQPRSARAGRRRQPLCAGGAQRPA